MTSLVTRKVDSQTHYFATELDNQKQVEVTCRGDGDESIESLAKDGSDGFSTPSGSTPASTPQSTPRGEQEAAAAPEAAAVPEAAAPPETTPEEPKATEYRTAVETSPKSPMTPQKPLSPTADEDGSAAGSPTLNTKMKDINRSNQLLEKQLEGLRKVLAGYAAKHTPGKRIVGQSVEDRLKALEKQNARYRKENEALSRQIAEQEAWLNQSVQMTPAAKRMAVSAGDDTTPLHNGAQESLSAENEAKDHLLKQLRQETTRLQTQIKLQVKTLDKQKKLTDMLDKLKVGASAEEELLRKQLKAVVDEKIRVCVLGEAAEREHAALLQQHFPKGETGVSMKELRAIEATDALVQAKEKEIAGLGHKQEVMKKSLANEKLKTNRSLADHEQLLVDLERTLQKIARTLDSKRALLDRNRGTVQPQPPPTSTTKTSPPRKPLRLDPVQVPGDKRQAHTQPAFGSGKDDSVAPKKPAGESTKKASKDGGLAHCFESVSGGSRASSPVSSVSSLASDTSPTSSLTPTASGATTREASPRKEQPEGTKLRNEEDTSLQNEGSMRETSQASTPRSPRQNTDESFAAMNDGGDEEDENDAARVRFLFPVGGQVKIKSTGAMAQIMGSARGRVGISLNGGVNIFGALPCELELAEDEEDESETKALRFKYPEGSKVVVVETGALGEVVGLARGRVGVDVDGSILGFIPCHIVPAEEEDEDTAKKLRVLYPQGTTVTILESGAMGAVIGSARGRVGVNVGGEVRGYIPCHIAKAEGQLGGENEPTGPPQASPRDANETGVDVVELM